MQNLQIRTWQISDLEDVEKLLKQIPTYTGNIKRDFFSKLYTGKVVLADGKIVGFVLYWILESEVEIHAIIVDKNHRKRNIGTALMASVIDEIASLHKPFTIFLEVSEKNIPAIKLYQQFKFKKVAVRKNYYKNGDNALVLMLKINPTEVEDVQRRKPEKTCQGKVPPFRNTRKETSGT
ncbi:ribosomal protein S18-alanine N-acetyltransferase [Desulfurobacterium sp.]